MATQLLNVVDETTTSGAVSAVTGVQPDRVVFIWNTGDASTQVELSPDGADYFPYGAAVEIGLHLIRVPPQVHVRVVTTITTGETSAWVA